MTGRIILSIPGFIEGLNPEVERLMYAYGRVRRCAYSMKRKGANRLEIIRRLPSHHPAGV